TAVTCRTATPPTGCAPRQRCRSTRSPPTCTCPASACAVPTPNPVNSPRSSSSTPPPPPPPTPCPSPPKRPSCPPPPPGRAALCANRPLPGQDELFTGWLAAGLVTPAQHADLTRRAAA